MDIKRKQEQLNNLLDKIELLDRYDKRNLQIEKMLSKEVRMKKLIKAGCIFEQAGILDSYDEHATLCLLTNNKETITLSGENKNGID